MSMILNMMFSVLMFIVGVMVYSMKRKHLLSMLLSLEFIVLSLFYMLYLYMLMYNYEFYFSMIFLTFSVCEGALGLSILVSMIRTHGNDYFQSFSILQC
uniref:NADH-ubiquinone oxidoreductase chain 4L n=1 Tax=Thyridosmylus langii TaxID=1305651 RepID=R9R0E6_9NEOP|nr:NADH dehydrogenase subunit 4L [Thyridosmylus langii]AGH27225.1 NADH dehydrogenase subunit 4L [Thyridosmylus langii]